MNRIPQRKSRSRVIPVDQFHDCFNKTVGLAIGQQAPFNRLDALGRVDFLIEFSPANDPTWRCDATAGAEAPADSHSVYWTATSSAGLKRPVRNAHRWRLWICSDYVRRLSDRLRAICHPVETSAPPHGGGGGNRTRVQNASGLPELRSCPALWGPWHQNSRPDAITRLRSACSSHRGKRKPVCCAPGSSPEKRCSPSATQS
jgi:hypothetical protein